MTVRDGVVHLDGAHLDARACRAAAVGRRMSTPASRPRVRAGETLGIALEAVRTHRMRSLLTVLGIWIGIASVTLTVGLGQGAQQQVAEQINSLGSNLLVVSPGSSTTGGVRGGRGTATTLTIADAEALADQAVAPDVAHVAPGPDDVERADRGHHHLDDHGDRDHAGLVGRPRPHAQRRPRS